MTSDALAATWELRKKDFDRTRFRSRGRCRADDSVTITNNRKYTPGPGMDSNHDSRLQAAAAPEKDESYHRDPISPQSQAQRRRLLYFRR